LMFPNVFEYRPLQPLHGNIVQPRLH
jgi:hypothetical protein